MRAAMAGQSARQGGCAVVLALLLVSARAQAGDAARGQALYTKTCAACHSVDRDVIGPRHRGVVGRPAGAVAGFPYSEALRASGVVWTEPNLDRWLTNPEAMVPGQRMGYLVPEAQDRADIIAYLATQTTP